MHAVQRQQRRVVLSAAAAIHFDQRVVSQDLDLEVIADRIARLDRGHTIDVLGRVLTVDARVIALEQIAQVDSIRIGDRLEYADGEPVDRILTIATRCIGAGEQLVHQRVVPPAGQMEEIVSAPPFEHVIAAVAEDDIVEVRAGDAFDVLQRDRVEAGILRTTDPQVHRDARGGFAEIDNVRTAGSAPLVVTRDARPSATAVIGIDSLFGDEGVVVARARQRGGGDSIGGRGGQVVGILSVATVQTIPGHVTLHTVGDLQNRCRIGFIRIQTIEVHECRRVIDAIARLRIDDLGGHQLAR